MARGRPYNGTIAAVQKWATKLHAAVYRATGGKIGGRMVSSPVLLLITTGRRTGEQRTTPFLYLEDGDGYAIVASNGGAPDHPAWWMNLEADPEAKVEIGGEKIRVRASEAMGEERHRLWERLVGMYPAYEDYRRRTDRAIPVVRLRIVD